MDWVESMGETESVMSCLFLQANHHLSCKLTLPGAKKGEKPEGKKI